MFTASRESCRSQYSVFSSGNVSGCGTQCRDTFSLTHEQLIATDWPVFSPLFITYIQKVFFIPQHSPTFCCG